MIKKMILAMVILMAGTCQALAENETDAVSEQKAAAEAHYTIGNGDVLFISVWKDESLSKNAVVLPDGTISFPLIGEMQAAGRTVSQLKNEINEKISRFVPDPILTVEVQQVNSMIVYVIGKVNKPGRFNLNCNINVLQALSMAGGMNPFAEEDEIKIFREKDSRTTILKFNYEDVSEGQNLAQNIQLQRGDVIVVP